MVLAVVLIGTTIPILEDARRSTARTNAAELLDRIERAIRALVAHSDPTRVLSGASRTIDLTYPRKQIGSAGVAWVAVGGIPGQTETPFGPHANRLGYQVAGETVVRRVEGAAIRVSIDGEVQPAGTPLIVRGDTRLVLSYRQYHSEPIILISTGDLCPNTGPAEPCSSEFPAYLTPTQRVAVR